MLPALAGMAVKALLPSGKKIDKDKLLNKKESSAIQKVDDEKGVVKSPTIQRKTISTNLFLPPAEIKALPPAAEVKKDVKTGRLDDIFDRVGETLQGIINVLSNRNQTQREEEENKKEEAKVEEKKEREEKLEKDARKKPVKKPNVKLPKDRFNIMRFFGNVLLGSLALAIFNNLEQIMETLKNVFQTIKDFIAKLGEFFSPLWNGFKWIVGKGTELIGQLLGIPKEDLDDEDILKNLNEIKDKIPGLKQLFEGINSTIESLRSGRGLDSEQPQSGASGGGGGGITPGGEMPGVNVASSEQDLLLRLIIAEASGEGEIGMAAVARSVLNRAGLVQSGKRSPGTFNMKSGSRGSITDVITAPLQYQPYRQGKLNKPLSEGQKRAALNALALAQNVPVFKQKLLQEGLSESQANVILASTGFRNYSAGADIDTSQQVNEVVLKRHTFNTAGNTGLLVPGGARINASPVEKQQVLDTTAQQAATAASTPAPAPSVTPSTTSAQVSSTSTPSVTPSTTSAQVTQAAPAQAAPSLQPSAPAQAQVAPTQPAPAVSASVPQIMQQADYEIPGGTPSSTILPIPIVSGSSPMMMGGRGTKLLPVGVSKQALLNSYYQAQLTGFLYKQG